MSRKCWKFLQIGLQCLYIYIKASGVGSKFKLRRGGGHELSGEFLNTERAPSNIIWILFDYIFFRIKRALFILFKMLGGKGMGARAPHTPRFLRPSNHYDHPQKERINRTKQREWIISGPNGNLNTVSIVLYTTSVWAFSRLHAARREPAVSCENCSLIVTSAQILNN